LHLVHWEGAALGSGESELADRARDQKPPPSPCSRNLTISDRGRLCDRHHEAFLSLALSHFSTDPGHPFCSYGEGSRAQESMERL
jgi:hypothetical protein